MRKNILIILLIIGVVVFIGYIVDKKLTEQAKREEEKHKIDKNKSMLITEKVISVCDLAIKLKKNKEYYTKKAIDLGVISELPQDTVLAKLTELETEIKSYETEDDDTLESSKGSGAIHE